MNYTGIEKNARQQLYKLLIYLWEQSTSTQSNQQFHDELHKAIRQGQGLPHKYDFKVDIVFGYAYSIKKYYMESGNPKQMRGASLNLNKIFKDNVIRYLVENHIEECAYYTGGSQIFIIVPEGAGVRAATEIEGEFNRQAPTANNAAITLSCTVNQLLVKDQFTRLKKLINQACMTRRMLKYDSNLLSFHCPEPDLSKQQNIKKYYGSEMRCSRCRLRIPEYIVNFSSLESDGDEVLLCRSCAYKEIGGGSKARNDFKIQCKKVGEKLLPDMRINISREYDSTNDLKDQNGNIALIYADVNNLGGAGLLPKGIIGEKVFFDAVKDTVMSSLSKSLILAMKRCSEDDWEPEGVAQILESKFEIIAVGGDDICLLVPGQIALYTAVLLVEEFEEKWIRDYQKGFLETMGDESHLSLSAGIALASANTPLTYMQMTAEQLLSSAKKLAHHSRKNKYHGAIDILSLNSDGQWAAELDFLRDYEDERNPLFKPGAKMTMRPFAIQEAKAFLSVLADADKLPNHMLQTIDAACKRMNIAEGSLFFDYKMTKLEEKERKTIRSLYKKLQVMKGIEVGGKTNMYLVTATGQYIAPWHDILDLLDQMGNAGGEDKYAQN